MNQIRTSGIILHPTSLPGPDGIGDLGPEAYRWIEFLSSSGCGLWQVLPLGPTGYGDSPYQCFSAFAGNYCLISPILLLEEGLLRKNFILDRPSFPSDHVEYGEVIKWKKTILELAFIEFRRSRKTKLRNEFIGFVQSQTGWLDDYSVFMALKEKHEQKPWYEWPQELKEHDPEAIRNFHRSFPELIEKYKFFQFIFFRQWRSLKQYANKRGIKIIGDIPIFVANDSSDAWSHPELFIFNSNLRPVKVAGVPPDYFSPSGQLWGNPLYRWKIHRKDNFSWWSQRVKSNLTLFDIIRLDHFRGFVASWEIPYGEETAKKGKWVKGPGKILFDAISRNVGQIPLIAEDLGEITPDVITLREELGIPGMKVLQFAFDGDPLNEFLPHNFPSNCVAYTGTHDNDTARGWYEQADEEQRDQCRRYLARSGEDIAWDMIRVIWSSVATMCLAPMQDLLNLSSESRMNFPSRAYGNWQWRMPADSLNDLVFSRLREMNELFGRMNDREDRSSAKNDD